MPEDYCVVVDYGHTDIKLFGPYCWEEAYEKKELISRDFFLERPMPLIYVETLEEYNG